MQFAVQIGLYRRVWLHQIAAGDVSRLRRPTDDLLCRVWTSAVFHCCSTDDDATSAILNCTPCH